MKFIKVFLIILIFNSCTNLTKENKIEEIFLQTFEIKEILEESSTISHEEYLLLSLLVYADFSKEHINKNIYEVLLMEYDELIDKLSIFSILKLNNKKDEFLDFYKEIFSQWEIVEISSNIDLNKISIWDDGFYALALRKKNTKELLISYRGSKFYPLHDAYKDFIRNNLFIRFRSKPNQFNSGLSFYKCILHKYSDYNISLTGHSLGGGIAQYVFALSEIYSESIPKTVTFNPIGIHAKNLVKLIDFIDFEEEIKRDKNIPKYIKENLYIIDNVVKTELEKSISYKLFNLNFIRISKINEESLKVKIKIALLEKVIEKDLNYLVNTYYNKNYINSKLKNAKVYYNNFIYNRYVGGKLLNIIHGQDFTANLFQHIGLVYNVEKGTMSKSKYISGRRKNIFRNSKIVKFHNHNIFIPYLQINGQIDDELQLDYVKNLIKKIIKENIEFQNYLEDKNLFMFRLKLLEYVKGNKDLIYKNNIFIYLEKLEIHEFENFIKNIYNSEEKHAYDIWSI